jgi:phosphinothricin acetyltransferase
LEDASSICRIYNYYVENTAITFETSPVEEIEMRKRIGEVLESGCPGYVGEIDGKIVGYIYLHNWHLRRGYFQTKELTIYLDKDFIGKGLGTILFNYLWENMDRKEIHVILAVINVPNEESIKMHEKFGFKQVSFMKEVGWKFNQWRDIGHWQLIVNQL